MQTCAGFARLIGGRLAQLLEAVPELLGKKLGLLERREMTAPIEFVPIDQLRVVPLRPATRSAPNLVREDADSHRNADKAPGRACGRPVLPINPRRGGCRVCQPVKRDVVEHLVLCEYGFWIAVVSRNWRREISLLAPNTCGLLLSTMLLFVITLLLAFA